MGGQRYVFRGVTGGGGVVKKETHPTPILGRGLWVYVEVKSGKKKEGSDSGYCQ